MTKWYQKSIYIVTRKNFLSIFLLIFTIFFYILESITGKEKNISMFFFVLNIGQYIGDKFANRQKRNALFIFLLIFAIISYIIEGIIGSNKKITILLLSLAVGQQIGFLVAKYKAKNK